MEGKHGESAEVVVVGSGPVGISAAYMLAKKGYSVVIVERRSMREATGVDKIEQLESDDVRQTTVVRVNASGVEALRRVGVWDAIEGSGIVHPTDATEHIFGGRVTAAVKTAGGPGGFVQRAHVVRELSTLLEKSLKDKTLPGSVSVRYGSKVDRVDVDANTVSLVGPGGERSTLGYSFLVGADGGFSSVRRSLLSTAGFGYRQRYSTLMRRWMKNPDVSSVKLESYNPKVHRWHMSFGREGFFRVALLHMSDNMLEVYVNFPIAAKKSLPFLFATPSSPEELKELKGQLNEWLKKTMKEDHAYITDGMLDEYYGYRPGPGSIYIELDQYNVGNVLLMGDAAHAMIGSRGAGLNSGLGDVAVLDPMVPERSEGPLSGAQWAAIASKFDGERREDVAAIAEYSWRIIQVPRPVKGWASLVKKMSGKLMAWRGMQPHHLCSDIDADNVLSYKKQIETKLAAEEDNAKLASRICVAGAVLLAAGVSAAAVFGARALRAKRWSR